MSNDSICELMAENGNQHVMIKRFAEWIVSHPPLSGDFACEKCYPSSEIITNGFVCAYHEAVMVCLIDRSEPS